MTITVGIAHHTQYKYDRPVNMGPHIFRLRPAPHSRTKIKKLLIKNSAGRSLHQLAARPFW
ncbi:transglutaminase N-terminal domain-containing protein [Pseudoalteromonas sp. B160]|uniref:transglutaminase N-terminal domain-containing protein n=1 Tax=Pseudoalteromonas sp. B160 TaxID=630414 RepID=UPI00301E44D5